MCNYHTLGSNFLQYKRFLGYKYKTDEVVIKEIVKYLENNNINIITKEIVDLNVIMNIYLLKRNILLKRWNNFHVFINTLIKQT